MIKVSVIIPFYNQNIFYLEKAVTSVLNQTLKDIEIICIDDGSENQSCSVFIEKYMLKDNRIKLYKKEHSGAGESRNFGIEKSIGENIMFLDSDDYYPDNDILEKLYNLKMQNDVLIAGGKHLILNDNELEEPFFNYGNINDYFNNKKIEYKDYQFPWWYWCFMYDSSLIKNNGIFFPLYLRYQDPPFFVRVMNIAGTFYAADFISYIHRKSNKLYLMTAQAAKDHVQGICDILLYSKDYNLQKLHNFIYNTFFDFDINILKQNLNLSQQDVLGLVQTVKELSG